MAGGRIKFQGVVLRVLALGLLGVRFLGGWFWAGPVLTICEIIHVGRSNSDLGVSA